jgi:hypothetical protein
MGGAHLGDRAPDHFPEVTPTPVLVRQVLGATAEFEKASLAAPKQHGPRPLRPFVSVSPSRAALWVTSRTSPKS